MIFVCLTVIHLSHGRLGAVHKLYNPFWQVYLKLYFTSPGDYKDPLGLIKEESNPLKSIIRNLGQTILKIKE